MSNSSTKVRWIMLGILTLGAVGAIRILTSDSSASDGQTPPPNPDTVIVPATAEPYPSTSSIVASNVSGGWMRLDFLTPDSTTALGAAKYCVRTHRNVDAATCYAFASREAYQVTNPNSNGLEARPCYRAYWRRYPDGDESGLEVSPHLNPDCPSYEDRTATRSRSPGSYSGEVEDGRSFGAVIATEMTGSMSPSSSLVSRFNRLIEQIAQRCGRSRQWVSDRILGGHEMLIERGGSGTLMDVAVGWKEALDSGVGADCNSVLATLLVTLETR